jgi:hypothetical protein
MQSPNRDSSACGFDRVRYFVGLLAVSTLLLTGCAPHVPELVGLTAEQADDSVSGGLKVYDVSYAVVGTEPGYTFATEAKYTVIAACTKDDQWAFAVVPDRYFHGAVEATAEKHGYDKDLVECR